MSKFTYTLSKDCMTIFKNGIIVLDCPIERLRVEPNLTFQLLEFLDEVIQEKDKELEMLNKVINKYAISVDESELDKYTPF